MTIKDVPVLYGLAELISMFCPATITPLIDDRGPNATQYLRTVQLALPWSAAAAVAVVVADQQTPPVPAMSVKVQPGDVLNLGFDGRTMQGGMTVICDVPNAVSLAMRWS